MRIALWIAAVVALLVAELGIRREPRTTYEVPPTGYASQSPAADRSETRLKTDVRPLDASPNF